MEAERLPGVAGIIVVEVCGHRKVRVPLHQKYGHVEQLELGLKSFVTQQPGSE